MPYDTSGAGRGVSVRATQGNPSGKNETVVGRRPSGRPESPPIPQSPWNKPLVPVFSALVLGIILDAAVVRRIPFRLPVYQAGQWLALYTLLGCLLLLLWGVFLRAQRLATAGFSLWLSMVLLGAALHDLYANVFLPDEIGRYALPETKSGADMEAGLADVSSGYEEDRFEDPVAAAICMEAVLTAIPEVISPVQPSGYPFPIRWEEYPTTILRCNVSAVRDGTIWRSASGKSYIYVTGVTPRLLPGDRVRLTGRIVQPKESANPGEFDLRSHRRADRVLAEVYGTFAEGVHTVRRGTLWDPRRCLAVVRVAAADAIDRHVSPRNAALAKALLLGMSREVDDEFREQLLRTGTLHLLAISGLHVGIFAGVVVFALRRLQVRPRARYLAAIAAVAAYLAVSGGRPPTVRAAVILATYFFGKAILRRSSGWNSLAFAGIVVLACNPADLFRIGPQLSFLSAAVLIALGPRIIVSESADPLERLIFESRPRWQRFLLGLGRVAGQSFVISAVLCTVTAPLVMARFHIVAPMGMILTPLVLPPLSVTLVAGFLLMLLGPWCQPLGWIFGAACNAMLDAIRLVVGFGDAVPYGSLWLPGPPDWWLIGLYAVCGAGLFVMHPRFGKGVLSAVLVSWTLLLFSHEFAVLRKSRGVLECTVLSVGHGAAIPIHLPDGRTLLYDAGRLLGDRTAAKTVANYLWYRRVTHIDAVVLSHADLDHYNAVPKLMEYFSIGTVYVEPHMTESREPYVRELIAAVRRKGIPLKTLAEGWQARSTEGVRISVLHPPEGWPEREDNARSLVLRLQCGGEVLLLTGDLDGRGVDRILEHSEAVCSVLVAPHHGSSHGNPPALAERLRPRVVVMSNARPPARTVAASYRAAGSVIYETRRAGAVTIVLDAGRAKIRSFHGGRDLTGTEPSFPQRDVADEITR